MPPISQRWAAPVVLAAVLGVASFIGYIVLQPEEHWVRVTRDANYTIYIDSTRIDERDTRFAVWYRTDHALPRVHKDKTFNREVVHSLVDCRWGEFKVISVDLSTDGGSAISKQRTTERELHDQPWRTVEDGTAEEVAMSAACFYAGRKFPQVARSPRPRP